MAAGTRRCPKPAAAAEGHLVAGTAASRESFNIWEEVVAGAMPPAETSICQSLVMKAARGWLLALLKLQNL